MKWILFLFYPVFLILVHVYLYFKLENYKNAIRINRKFLVKSMIGIIILLNFLVLLFFVFENTIYFWDYSGFWTRTIDYINIIDNNGVKVSLQTLLQSMNYDEHSYLLCLFLSFPMKLLNFDFLTFILSILNLFVIPVILNTYLLMCILFEKANIYFNRYAIMIGIVCFVPLYFTMLYGYADVAGLLFIAFILITFFSCKIENFNLLDILFVVGNLLILIFLRRWYLFWVISFFIATAVFAVKTLNKELIIKSLTRLFFIGLILLFMFLTIFKPYLAMLLGNNLNKAYSAYRNDIFYDLVNYFKFYGLFFIALCILSIKNKKNVSDIQFLLLLSVTVIIIFYSIQSMDQHHLHLLNYQFLILSLIGIQILLELKYKNVVLVLLALNFIHAFNPIDLKYIHSFNNIFFTNVSRTPTKLIIKDDLIDLALTINNLAVDEQYAYFSASSKQYNADILRNCQLPYKRNAVPNLVNTSDVDLRDGFPQNFFKINYVITANPTQYHLDKEDQYINYLINDAIQNVDIVSENYRLIEIKTIGEVEIKIYERIKDYSIEAKDYFVNKIAEKYSQYSELINGIK